LDLTRSELKQAVAEYLTAGGVIIKVPTGVSGLYDEFGIPKQTHKGRIISPVTKERLGQVRRLRDCGVADKEIAKRLGMSRMAFAGMMRRWGS
jgi:DNA-binding NarL/FixJ family response regulator